MKNVLLLMMAATRLSAGIVTVDADGFPDGTPLNNLFPGVTLTAFGSLVPTQTVTPFTSPFATTGGQVFANEFREDWTPGEATLLVEFATPTSFVAIDFINNDGVNGGSGVDFGQLVVFFLGGATATVTTGSVNANEFRTLSYTRPTADIIALRIGGAQGEDILLDNLRYYSDVPEPSTFRLLLLGLGVRVAWQFVQRKNSRVAPF